VELVTVYDTVSETWDGKRPHWCTRRLRVEFPRQRLLRRARPESSPLQNL